MNDPPNEDVPEDVTERVARLERRLERERAARIESERIAEQSLRSAYERTRELEVIATAARLANESTSFEDAVVGCQRVAAEFFGAIAAHSFRVAPGGERLIPTNLWWVAPNTNAAALHEATRTTEFGPDVGLPGRIWNANGPVLIERIIEQRQCPRAVAVDIAGGEHAVGFPVIVGDTVVAVLELFCPASADLDPARLGIGIDIALQLGRVLERQAFDASVRRARDALEESVLERTEELSLEILTVHRLHSEMENLAYTDTLTGLANRTLFLRALDEACADVSRIERLAVIMLDLDYFKVVNDSLGHAAGDEMLVKVAHRLRTGTREHDLVARLGGDEFVVLCADVNSDDAAMRAAARIAAATQEPYLIAGQTLRASMSIGVSRGRIGATATELLREADTAAYHAKDQGRDRFEMFDAELRDRARSRLDTEAGLHAALRNDLLVPFYQPIIDLQTATVVGFEALIRWNSDQGLRLPGSFIEIAEASDLILQIGEQVLRRSVAEVESSFTPSRQVAGQVSGQRAAQRTVLSVNVSGRQLLQRDFVRIVADVLDGTSLDPSMLCLEITETVLMRDVDAAIRQLDRLGDLGVKLAIDDFGTGYSSLSYLRRFPIHVVKIDQSFVDDLGRDNAGSAIVAAIVNLAHVLGLTVVAEGVETHEQLASLYALDCDHAQGFLFARPMPGAEALPLLGTRVSPPPSELRRA